MVDNVSRRLSQHVLDDWDAGVLEYRVERWVWVKLMQVCHHQLPDHCRRARKVSETGFLQSLAHLLADIYQTGRQLVFSVVDGREINANFPVSDANSVIYFRTLVHFRLVLDKYFSYPFWYGNSYLLVWHWYVLFDYSNSTFSMAHTGRYLTLIFGMTALCIKYGIMAVHERSRKRVKSWLNTVFVANSFFRSMVSKFTKM